MNRLTTFPLESIVRLGEGRFIFRIDCGNDNFIYISYGHRKTDFDDKLVKGTLTFLSDGGNGKAAEWEPEYGPIHIWEEGEGRPHWHFESVLDKPLNWSQLAVDREGLKDLLIEGNIDGVFAVLKRWAE